MIFKQCKVLDLQLYMEKSVANLVLNAFHFEHLNNSLRTEIVMAIKAEFQNELASREV